MKWRTSKDRQSAAVLHATTKKETRQARKKIAPEIEKKIIKLYSDGMTIGSIKVMLRLPSDEVSKVIHDAGIMRERDHVARSQLAKTFRRKR